MKGTAVAGTRRLCAVVAVATVGLIPTDARAQSPTPCASDAEPALAFTGLPRALVIGRIEGLGFDDNDDSEAEAPGSIKVTMLNRHGHAFFKYTIDPGGRGDDLVYLRIDLGDQRVKIQASYLEQNPDGTQCKRVIAQRVRELRRIYFPSRCNNPGIRPSSVIIACGDGGLQLRAMHWRGWHRTATSGRGRALANDCIPNCAAGTFHRIGVKVRLTKPRLCKNIAQYVYGRIAWRFSSSPPGGARRSGSVGFPCSFYDEF